MHHVRLCACASPERGVDQPQWQPLHSLPSVALSNLQPLLLPPPLLASREALSACTRVFREDHRLELLNWDLGRGDSPDVIADLAALMRSTLWVLDRTHCFTPHRNRLRLAWSGIPCHSTLSLIAPAAAQLRLLTLHQWDVDGELLRLLAETQPRLQKLTLSSCRTCGATWACLAALPALTHLTVLSAQPMSFLDEDFRQLALFVSGLDR